MLQAISPLMLARLVRAAVVELQGPEAASGGFSTPALNDSQYRKRRRFEPIAGCSINALLFKGKKNWR
jgi:hypothetical protein